MAETEVKPEVAEDAVVVPIPAIVVPRNDVEVTYELQKILKGTKRGTQYPCPDVNKLDWDTVQKWMGVNYIKDVIQANLKAVHQKIFWDCIDATTGQVDWAKFLQKAKDFTVTGLKIKELERKISELGEALGERLAAATATDFANTEWQAETNKLNEEARGFRALLEDKRRNKEEDTETDVEASIPVR